MSTVKKINIKEISSSCKDYGSSCTSI